MNINFFLFSVMTSGTQFEIDGEKVEVAKTYVFGDYEDLESLSLHSSDISPGFIELSFDGSSLSIDLVRRPSYWPNERRFCSNILPAAIFDFISSSIMISVEDIKDIFAYNISTEPFYACLCYVGVITKMGFDIVNGVRVHSANRYCYENSHKGHHSYSFLVPSDTIPRLPDVDLSAMLTIALAHTETRIRPLGFS
jgi:hypothetical protein